MSNENFTINFELFDKTFFKLVENAIPREVEKGILKAANLILDDAEATFPMVPKEFDHLRGSRTVENIVFTHASISGSLGYNIEYAAYQHEGERKDGSHKVENYTTEKGVKQPGKKFLEKSLLRNKEKAVKVIVKHINNAKA